MGRVLFTAALGDGFAWSQRCSGRRPCFWHVWRRTPEVVTTLLLNWVALHLATYLAAPPLHARVEQGPRTPTIQSSAMLPRLAASSRYEGLFLAVSAASIPLALILSWWAPASSCAGAATRAARSAGMQVETIGELALRQSGALAGLAGPIEPLGLQHVLRAGFAPGNGYERITVRILGGNAPSASSPRHGSEEDWPPVRSSYRSTWV